MAQRPPPTPRMESEVVVKGYKPRRFPWRLWLYAILVTGAAGGAGYFAWQYRTEANTTRDDSAACMNERDTLRTTAAEAGKRATTCQAALATSAKKTTDLEKQNGESTKDLSATKDELTQLRAQKAEADKRMAAIEDIRKQFAKMTDTGQLRVTARHGQLVVSLPAEVLFPSGSTDLSKQGEYAVVEVAAVLKRFPERRFLIVGHTDNQDLAKQTAACPFKDNLQLSTERALTVTRVLVTAGMDVKNLLPSGAGDHDPVASNASAEGRQKNRRIEIALLPAINELPALPPTLTEDPAPKK
ncbi:MAG: OmpA family protein [Kofleriaceae bacterium]